MDIFADIEVLFLDRQALSGLVQRRPNQTHLNSSVGAPTIQLLPTFARRATCAALLQHSVFAETSSHAHIDFGSSTVGDAWTRRLGHLLHGQIGPGVCLSPTPQDTIPTTPSRLDAEVERLRADLRLGDVYGQSIYSVPCPKQVQDGASLGADLPPTHPGHQTNGVLTDADAVVGPTRGITGATGDPESAAECEGNADDGESENENEIGALSTDLRAQIDESCALLRTAHDQDTDDTLAAAVDSVVKLLRQCGMRPLFQSVCEALAKCRDDGFWPDLLMPLCQHYLTKQTSPQDAAIFLRHSVLPVVLRLHRPCSRSLYCAVSAAVEAHAVPTIDALLVPSITAQSGPGKKGDDDARGRSRSRGLPQCELVKRIIREHLPLAAAPLFLQRVVAIGWVEAMLPVVQTILNSKSLVLSEELVSTLVRRFDTESQSDTFVKSLKFAATIHTFVTKFGPQASAHDASLKRSLSRSTAFMAKVTLKALAKLRHRK